MSELKQKVKEVEKKYHDLCKQLFYMESGDEYNRVKKERDKALHELNVATGKLRGWEDYD